MRSLAYKFNGFEKRLQLCLFAELRAACYHAGRSVYLQGLVLVHGKEQEEALKPQAGGIRSETQQAS